MIVQTWPSNQWPASQFHAATEKLVRYECAMTLVDDPGAQPLDQETARQQALATCLECAVPAGNA